MGIQYVLLQAFLFLCRVNRRILVVIRRTSLWIFSSGFRSLQKLLSIAFAIASATSLSSHFFTFSLLDIFAFFITAMLMQKVVLFAIGIVCDVCVWQRARERVGPVAGLNRRTCRRGVATSVTRCCVLIPRIRVRLLERIQWRRACLGRLSAAISFNASFSQWLTLFFLPPISSA